MFFAQKRMRMRLYAFYTSSHKKLLDEWFLPSLKDDFELVLEEHTQECLMAKFMSKGWNDCMIRKVDLIIRAIQENPDQIFIHSDVDIQFFKPTKEIILKSMKGHDMVIQKESLFGTICPGFFATYGNSKNLKLWQDIKQELAGQSEKHDQDILNDKLIRSAPNILQIIVDKMSLPNRSFLPNLYGIKWGYLPDSFYSPGISKEKTFSKNNILWQKGDKLTIPKNILLHHANWTIGMDNKIAQLEYVKGVVNPT